MEIFSKVHAALGAGALAVLLFGCPRTVAAQDSTTSSGRDKMDDGSRKMMKSPDTAFAIKAAQGGMAEVQLGQMAAQKASSPDVKAFGQRMVDDHSKANDQLKSIAGKEGITLPTALNAKDSALNTKLQNESGTKFDHDYVKAMVKDHEEDVKEFQKEANAGSDPQIKNFASETLPTLQSHLQSIQQIHSSMGSK